MYFKKLNADLQYTSKGVRLKNLLLITPGTEIKRSVAIHYPTIKAFQNNMELLELDLDLRNSRVQVKDILTFVPELAKQPVFKNPEDILLIHSRLKGSLAWLNIYDLQISGFQHTRADFSGTASHITDPHNYAVNLLVNNISTTREDLLSFLPPKTMPDSITLPENMSLSGKISGGAAHTYTDIAIATSLGDATIKGTVNNAANPDKASYAAAITMQALNVGRIIQQPETVGKVTAHFTIKGSSFDVKKVNAKVKGMVNSAEYNQYTYRNIRLDGAIANQKFTAEGGMRDPNLHFAFEAKGNLSGAHPGFVVTANIDSIKTAPLHLTADALIYRGKISANFPEFNLDSLNGQLLMTQSLLVANNQRITLDSVEVIAVNENNQQLITAKTAFLDATLSGEYKLTQLGDIFINSIQPYFAINSDTIKVLPDPYQFTINARLTDHPALRALIPDLRRLDVITLKAGFSNTAGWNANLASPYILLDLNKVVDLNITANTQGGRLLIVTDVAEISSGEYMGMTGTRLRAEVANNTIDFALRVGDIAGRDRYKLQGLLAKEPENIFSLSFRPDSLMLNYETWSINNENLIRFGPTMVYASLFDLSKDNQHLLIHSESTAANSPLEVQFVNFRMATLTGFVQKDTLLADGTLNGNILLNDLTTQPNFTTDLTINNLAINRDTIGDFNAKIDNVKANVFATHVTITGRGNDVALTGNYFLKTHNKTYMELNLAIKSLQLNTFEGASMGIYREGKGYLGGNIHIGGTSSAPDIDGGLSFHQTSMVVTKLNNEFRIDDEQVIAVDNSGLRFTSFTIRDFADNRLTINGMALTKNYLDYKFDLNVQARNFRGLNSTKKDNERYYGQLFFDINLKITGTDVSPVADGNLRINEDTRFTFVLPQSQPGIVEREGIVVFVDKDAPANDSLFLAAIDSLNKTSILGMEVSANIEVDKKAVLNLVIDEGNGDFIKLQGEAVLNGSIDKSGKISLTGSYELEEGAYEMSFNLLRRRFDIQKGSKITWTGEPTAGILDITAVYIANTSAIELVQDQIIAAKTDLRYRQRLPFEVHLHMAGPLMQPLLTFDIILPEESSVRIDNEIAGQVEMRLNQLKAEPSELNKQVFALLLLNRFVSENPFAGAIGAINANTLARQSVSKILTEQLNNLAENLINGVDINFDVVSTEDYTSGNLQNKTDLNIGVSKRLLNDRLNVSVGTNFALEGGRQTNQTGAAGSSISPNLNVEYLLTQNGAYRIRAYRRNEYEGVVEGYVVETGVGFVISVDYNQFKEVFEMRKLNQRLARERKRLESENVPPEKPANGKPDATIDNRRKDEEKE
ncbi:MAG: translocation/assembly module TamB [Saprospiraceae bacterium]|nr:translocation/assembly module TamB [Saprospiraceae bacterium]